MPNYSAADIVGKTLWAKANVPYRRSPEDAAPIAGYFVPGSRVGVVDTYFEVQAGRSSLYWGFFDAAGQPYYTPHTAGMYDLDQLRAQGVLSTEEKEAQAQSLPERITSTLVKGLLAYGVIRVAGRIFF